MPDWEKVLTHLDDMRLFADTRVHQIVSPKNWEVYSDLCDFIDLVKGEILALLEEQEWHMLTEDDDGIIHGLPGDDGQYFMTDGKDIWIDDYVDGVEDEIILDSGRDIREITAWKYMPELPKMDRR